MNEFNTSYEELSQLKFTRNNRPFINAYKSEQTIKFDVWNPWSNKSNNIQYKSRIKYIGNGEEKLASELDITTRLGGQNNTVDLVHHEIGNISVKDMTNDDCILGSDGSQHMRTLFRKVVYPLSSWAEKYRYKCEYAKDIYNSLDIKYGISRTTIFDGIERSELSKSNLTELNNILECVKKAHNELLYQSISSEYIVDICEYLKEESLHEKLNDCVRQEAINKTLIVVDKIKGWIIVKDLSKITCPRITRGSPRINIEL
tara:strand:- start:507 stop:1283 length:777 start_codon:yes stop_codon:yes gene_type:complete